MHKSLRFYSLMLLCAACGAMLWLGASTLAHASGNGSLLPWTAVESVQNEAADVSATLPFVESFDSNNGAGGVTDFSGSIEGAASVTFDHADAWTASHVYAGEKCALVGSGSEAGSLQTATFSNWEAPVIARFRLAGVKASGAAAASQTKVVVSLQDGTFEDGTSSKTLVPPTASWTDFSFVIKGSSATRLTIGSAAGTDQFYVDDVKIYTVGKENPVTAITLKTTDTKGHGTYASANVTIEKTYKADKWYAVSLPFALTEAQVKAVFGDDTKIAKIDMEIAGETSDADGNVLRVVNFTTQATSDMSSIAYPYLIRPSQTVDNPVFEGVAYDDDTDNNVDLGANQQLLEGVNSCVDFYGTFSQISTSPWGGDNTDFQSIKEDGTLTFDLPIEAYTAYLYAGDIGKVTVDGTDLTELNKDAPAPQEITLTADNNKTFGTFASANVTLEKAFKSGKWYTVSLPFTLTAEQVKAAFGDDVVVGKLEVERSDESMDENGEGYLHNNFVSQSSVAFDVLAYPYLLRPSKDVTNPVFAGVAYNDDVNNDMTIADNQQVLQGLNGADDFYGIFRTSDASPDAVIINEDGEPEATGSVDAFTAYFPFAPTLQTVSIDGTPLPEYKGEVVELSETATDNAAKIAAQNGKAVNVKVNVTLTANQWNTLYLPFALTSSQITDVFGAGTQVAEYVGLNTAADGGRLVFTTTGEMSAQRAYLVKPAKDVTSFELSGVTIDASTSPYVPENGQWSFRGTYDQLTDYISENNGLLAYLAAESKIRTTSLLESFSGLHGFFESASENDPEVLDIYIDGVSTGIRTVFRGGIADGQSRVYNLNGQYVGRSVKGLPRGVYVVGGQKVVVK